MKFILGLKLGISQIFDEKGNVVPVTVVEAGPCQVTHLRTKEKDGYQAVQVGFLKKEKKVKKTEKGKEFKILKEFKNKKNETGDYQIGSQIDVSIFQEGDKVSVAGTSKGKGFQGSVRRWGFKGRLSTTHGTKHELRTVGSVGSSFPERVVKGKKMPGRMGGERVTVRNLKVVKIDKDNNLLVLKGAVPGQKGSLLEIRG